MSRTHLPVIQPKETGGIRHDGSRRVIHPADVKGRWLTARRWVYVALIGVWLALPLIPVNGHPAIFLDVGQRSFYLFGATFRATDVWMLFFLVTGVALTIALLTAVLGRVWCGWACPQTVFLELVFRPIERLIDGSAAQRRKLDAAPTTASKVARRALKYSLLFIASTLVAHIFVGYFVSLSSLKQMVVEGPAAHPATFAWSAVLTVFFFVDFALFREQLCLVVCPYGRLQSVLFDNDTLVIGYDERRGEPRGKASQSDRGDCVDCGRCVAVCPTGIDIRDGVQLDCIACTACIDACDEIMDKVHQPRGLIRYDSMPGLAGQPRRLLRGRVYAYAAILVLGLGIAAVAFSGRGHAEATLTRARGVPYVVEDGYLRNSFLLKLKSKSDQVTHYDIQAPQVDEVETFGIEPIELEPGAEQTVPIMVRLPDSAYRGDQEMRFTVTIRETGEVLHVKGRLVGPG